MPILDKIKQLWPFNNYIRMKSVGFDHALPISSPNVFFEKNVLKPKPKKGEILVKVVASAINPVDIKMRLNYHNPGEFRILGFDAVGYVEDIGQDVDTFSIGDKVFYAGQQITNGALSEYQTVKASLVGHAPLSLKNHEIAAMPLTSITAFEIMNEAFNLEVRSNIAEKKTILIINGAGGVGSILIQLAKYMGMTVVTTASQARSVSWVKNLGADYILDYHQNLEKQLKNIQHESVDYVAILHDTSAYFDFAARIIKPFGRITSIVDTKGPIDIGPLKNIGAQFNWVFMFAKGNFEINMQSQGKALNNIAELIDLGVIQSTVTKTLKGLSADNVIQATKMIEDGHNIGKVVIDYED